MKKLLQLNFLPRSADLALLLLRVYYGFALFLLHGKGKLEAFSTMRTTFYDPLGVGHSTSYFLALFGEVVFPILIVLGLFTRLAALGSAFGLSVAFFLIHKGQLSGPSSGELAFLYIGAFLALFIAGGGRFSVDAKLGAKA
ncbi:MAG: DoxX family protein [Opitutaceae bacterium]|nr:DoxX family protein [Opitutaceae bacterium]